MDRQKLEDLQQRVDAVSQRYDARFAGKARATRDLDELDEIIGELRALHSEGQSLMNGDNSELQQVLETAQSNVDLYTEERKKIVDVKGQGPDVVEGAMLASWANFVFDEYRRHFAGQNRATRDLGRVDEMVAELEGIQHDMKALLERADLGSTRQDLGVVESNLKMYRDELENILAARRQGSRDERISSLANMANEQFRIYREQFGGKGRTTRRPGLLERVIKNLKGLLSEMRDLNAKGARSQSNVKNINIVQENLKLYGDELKAIKEARDNTSLEDFAGMLGGAANDVMADYREHFAGQSRASRDLQKLSTLIDEMYEIALQMREVQDAREDLEVNNRNLQIVLDQLTMYQTEYQRIQEAKGQS